MCGWLGGEGISWGGLGENWKGGRFMPKFGQ